MVVKQLVFWKVVIGTSIAVAFARTFGADILWDWLRARERPG